MQHFLDKFVTFRMFDIGDPIPQNATVLGYDPISQSMKNQLNKMVKHVKKKIYILTSLPAIIDGNIAKIVEKLRSGADMDEFDVRVFSSLLVN